MSETLSQSRQDRQKTVVPTASSRELVLSETAATLFWFGFGFIFVDLVQAEIICEERTLIKKMSPLAWPMGM